MRDAARWITWHLSTALRTLLLLRLPAEQPAPRALPVFVLLLLTASAGFLYESVEAGPDADFDPLGSVTTAIGWLAVAGLVLFLRHKIVRPIPIGTTVGLIAGVAFWFWTALLLGTLLTGSSWWQTAVTPAFNRWTWLSAWGSIAIVAVPVLLIFMGYWRIGRYVSRGMPLRIGLAFPVALVLLSCIIPNKPVFSGPNTVRMPSLFDFAWNLWGPGEASDETASTRHVRIDIEAAWDRQPDLVAKSLAQLAPSKPGTPKAFFVGAAMYSGQDVFKREISSARSIIDSRYDTAGRSLLLINHRETLSDLPFASATNLEKILAGVGRVMDVEKDVLVLFLTSHGSKGSIAVEFSGFGLNSLTPERLAAMLDRSGIKNRVIILSACHAGSFIPALMTPHSLVLAAAHADKTSFGCSHEREWTYFGDALFNHALRKTRSFPEAFRMAAETVGGWEKMQGLTPSEPQMFIGAEVEARLLALERHLDVDPGPPKPSAQD